MLFIVLLFIFGCQHEKHNIDRALEAIPSNSTVVTAFDLPQLLDKANFEEIQKMEFYQYYMNKAQEENDVLATAFANPENTGIDLDKNAYLAIELNPQNPEEIYMGLIFNLSDEEDFGALAQSLKHNDAIQKRNYQFCSLDDNTIIAWNEKVGVVALGEGIIESDDIVESFFDSESNSEISNNPNLIQLLNQKHDIASWVSTNALAKSKGAKILLNMIKIKPAAFEDNFIHASMDFEQGKVTAAANYIFKDVLNEDLHLLIKDKVKTPFSSYIPSQNLNGSFALALDFEGISQVLNKRPQVKAFANFFLKTYALSVDRIKNTFDGDLLMATYTGNVNNRMEGLFATKINNQDSFEELMNIAEEKEWVTKTGKGRYRISPTLFKILTGFFPIEIGDAYDSQLIIKEGIAFLSSNIDLLDEIEAGPDADSSIQIEDLSKIINQNPLSLFLDFNALKRIGISRVESLSRLEFKSDKRTANFRLDMQEKEGNSLLTIFKAINTEFKKSLEQKQPVSQTKS